MYRTDKYPHYRQKHSKSRNSIVALLGSIVRFGRDFCLETSIHGFSHIAVSRRHWSERVLWVGITTAAIWGALDLSMGQLQRYNESPTVVALEKDFRTWQYSLPAITACDKNRVNPTKLPGVIKSVWNTESSDEKYAYYSRFVTTVANSDLFHLSEYQEFKDDESLNVDLYQLAISVMPDFTLKPTWSQGYSTLWTPVMTESGACYVTNSLAVADAAIIKPDPNDTTVFPLKCKYSSLSCYLILEITTVTVVYIHSPYDVVDITIPPISRIIPTLTRVSELSVLETGCGKGVRQLSPQRRGCLYTDETTQAARQVYSTNTCRLSCRSKLALKLCGCKPFYYFYEDGPRCSPAGMACLSAHAQALASNGGARCACSQQCEDASFRELTTDDQYWDKGPFVNRGAVRFTVQAPRTRYTREIVFHFQDLVVSFGGAAGLFLGASFISFVEIFYFILERTLRVSAAGGPKNDVVLVQPKHTVLPYEASRVEALTLILEGDRRYEQGSSINLDSY